MTVALEVTELTAGYGAAKAVDGVSFRAGSGQIVALLGANGAGKTTTLLAISGLVPGATGRVTLEGRDLMGMAANDIAMAGVAHVPEGRALFYGLTVRDNLWLGSRRRDPSDALDLFPELAPLLDRKAGVLSGGEQQMLSLARALVAKPKVLLVDEMSLGLAPLIVERLMRALRTVADESHSAVVLVEQHIHMALDVADHAYIIGQGKILIEGPADTLAERELEIADMYLSGDIPADLAAPG